MFGISSFEFLVILLVALLVVGPDKMPGIIRRFTRLVSEFRRMKTDFHRTVNLELANLELAEQAPKKQPVAEAAPIEQIEPIGTDEPAEPVAGQPARPPLAAEIPAPDAAPEPAVISVAQPDKPAPADLDKPL
ncbi:MAG: twin-arginine translocase TatA/TatE family subunit [Deltaproteobacteria bacterium]|jgi:sec-independent protein translocase protein TatB|nr:twin-arginine translocase TatA/TatE family subunit [Deltaproteobacteria bacterium]